MIRSATRCDGSGHWPDVSSGHLGEVADGAKWTLGGRWGERVMSTGVIMVLARLLTPEDFGLVAVSTALVYFLAIIQDGGLPQALVQRDELRPAHVSTALTVNSLVSIVFTAGLLVGAPWIAAVLGQPDAALIIRVLTVNLLFGGLAAVPAAVLQRRLEFRSLALRKVASKAAGGTAALAVAIAGGGVWALVTQSIVQSVVGLAVLWWAIPDRPGFGLERRAFRELFSYGSFQLGSSVLLAATERGDNFAISRVLGAAALGQYNIAYRVLDILQQLFGRALSEVTMPVLSRRQTDRRMHRRASLDLIGLTFSVAAPAFVGWALVADVALIVLFGEQWRPAVVVSQLLAAVGMQRVLVQNLGMAINSVGRAGTTFRLQLLLAVTSFAVFVGFVGFGIETFAAAYAVAVWATVPVNFYALRRVLGIGARDVWSRLWTPIVGLVAMAVGVISLRSSGLLPQSDILVMLISVVAGALIYGAVLAALDRPLFERVVRRLRRERPAEDPVTPP